MQVVRERASPNSPNVLKYITYEIYENVLKYITHEIYEKNLRFSDFFRGYRNVTLD